MSKMSFRTSGSRAGDSTRPIAANSEPVLPRPKQLGVRIYPKGACSPGSSQTHRTAFVPRPAVTVPLTPDDYATAEDYK